MWHVARALSVTSPVRLLLSVPRTAAASPSLERSRGSVVCGPLGALSLQTASPRRSKLGPARPTKTNSRRPINSAPAAIPTRTEPLRHRRVTQRRRRHAGHSRHIGQRMRRYRPERSHSGRRVTLDRAWNATSHWTEEAASHWILNSGHNRRRDGMLHRARHGLSHCDAYAPSEPSSHYGM